MTVSWNVRYSRGFLGTFCNILTKSVKYGIVNKKTTNYDTAIDLICHAGVEKSDKKRYDISRDQAAPVWV